METTLPRFVGSNAPDFDDRLQRMGNIAKKAREHADEAIFQAKKQAAIRLK